MNRKTFVIAGIFIILAVGIGIYLSKQSGGSNSSRGPSPAVEQLVQDAADLEAKNELLQAKEIYQKILSDDNDFRDIDKVQKKFEDLNMRILFSALETPQTVFHEVVVGDSLKKISKQYNTTIELIKRSNNLTSDTIRLGQHLRIWKGVFSIFVDKSQNILILKNGNEVIKVYRVSTGKNNITPVGTFKIVDKLPNPVWFKDGKAIPASSPENILGTRWMGFDVPGYGIHGTTQPESIGQQATAGCVRMRNEEVEELYTIIPVGTQVTITD